jgi:hypothetical protein
MKPLSQMTREELYALDDEHLSDLLTTHADTLYIMTTILVNGRESVREFLDERRLELQQSAAESRHDSQQDR